MSFAVVTAIYTTLGFMGAKMFGKDVKSQITLSMPQEHIVTKIALWATVVAPMTKYALEFTPFAIQLEHALPSSMSGSLVSVAVCLILPCAFYVKICWGQISKPLLLLNLFLIIFGFVLAVMGTISSSQLLLKSLQSHNLRHKE